MPRDPQPEAEVDERAAHVAAAEQAPFPLFGLTADFTGPRTFNGVGRNGDVVNHVTLGHGLFSETTRIDVSVMGPLRGRARAGEWSIDPLPMIAVELLGRAGMQFASGQELMRSADDFLRHGFEEGRIRVGGRPWPFRFLRTGDHWAALHDLEPDHLLYLVASNTAPSDLELERLHSLAAYSQPHSR